MKIPKFKIGDKVKLLDDFNDVCKGTICEVIEETIEGFEHFYRTDVLKSYFLCEGFFEKVEESKQIQLSYHQKKILELEHIIAKQDKEIARLTQKISDMKFYIDDIKKAVKILDIMS